MCDFLPGKFIDTAVLLQQLFPGENFPKLLSLLK